MYPDHPNYPELATLTWWGFVGVQVFFVVSGYVIPSSSQGITAGKFALNRFRRLFPAALVCATLTTIFALTIQFARPQILWINYLRSLSFWPYGPWADSVYWTLGVELAFYVLTFGLIAFRRLNWLFPIMIGIAVVAATYTLFVHQQGMKLPFGPWSDRTEELLLLQHGMFFALGVALWTIQMRGLTFTRVAIVLGLSAAGLMQIYFSGQFLLRIVHDHQPLLLPMIAWTVCICLIAAAPYVQKRLPDRLLRARWPSRFGQATYPLYLFHNFVGTVLIWILASRGLDRYAAILAVVVLVISVAFAVTFWAEPAIRNVATEVGSAFKRRLRPAL